MNLRDVLKQVIQRQEWYKDYLKFQGEGELPFVGRYSTNDEVGVVVNDIRETLGAERPRAGTWEEYFRLLVERVEAAGILVMRSGVAGNGTNRKLDVSEFRGFAIADKLAPIVFINSADAPTARLFTFIHELAHIWIGSSGISDVEQVNLGNEEEVFCNAVAGEFLVPKEEFIKEWSEERDFDDALSVLSSMFHVSKMVIARRALDLGFVTSERYKKHYRDAVQAFRNSDSAGGNYYTNAKAKNSSRFSQAVVHETLSGRVLLRDAGRLLGVSPNNLKAFARKLSE